MDHDRPLSGYCTNVHAGTSLAETMANLERHARSVRGYLGDETLGIGLWIPESVLGELEDRKQVHELRSRIEDLGLFVFTMNGFPQHDFHAEVVKLNVYRPSWESAERAGYTRKLARVLSGLAPEHLPELSISTVPIGWRTEITDPGSAIGHLEATAEFLERLEDETGRLVHLDLEPEPGCLLDTAKDVVELFDRFSDRSRRYLRVCHDVCHSAVMFESQADAIANYRKAGIEIGKIQISSCPEARLSGEGEGDPALAALRAFMEPRYMHQATIRDQRGECTFHDDLPQALEAGIVEGTVRVHFHVPVHATSLGALNTTQNEIIECLRALDGRVPPLEVETYAWEVLPEEHRQHELARGIADELRWLRALLAETGIGSEA